MLISDAEMREKTSDLARSRGERMIEESVLSAVEVEGCATSEGSFLFCLPLKFGFSELVLGRGLELALGRGLELLARPVGLGRGLALALGRGLALALRPGLAELETLDLLPVESEGVLEIVFELELLLLRFLGMRGDLGSFDIFFIDSQNQC